MHHIYSLRPSRAPTAASLDNPTPEPSTSKTRRFLSNNIGHAIRRTAGGTLSPALAKKLSQLVAMEKNLLRSMENSSKERMDNAEKLSLWGDEQEDDLADVTDKLSVLLYEVGDLEDQYVDRYDQYRKALKQVRAIEKVVQPIRDKKEKLIEKITKLQTQDASSAELVELEQELERVEAESLIAEAQLSTITHEKIKGGFNYQFDAMREYGEKLAIIAGYGKLLLELIDDTASVPGEERAKYNHSEASTAIVQECDRALTTWVDPSSKHSNRLSEGVSSAPQEKENTVDTARVRPTKRDARRWSEDSEDGGKLSTIKLELPVAA